MDFIKQYGGRRYDVRQRACNICRAPLIEGEREICGWCKNADPDARSPLDFLRPKEWMGEE